MILGIRPNTNQTTTANNYVADQPPAIQAAKHTYTALTDNLEAMFAKARPRLLRFAQKCGVAPDAIDDVVQETLITAWRSLDHLRTPDRFDAWLIGICRNVCLRWSHAQRTPTTSMEYLPDLSFNACDTFDNFSQAEDIVDPLALDPTEELSRQDLAILLDRALGHLPPRTREVLELHYLSEFSQREVALRLGLSINALEVRLHRARRQLRQVLHNELRIHAQAFGLPLDDRDAPAGWCETRIWCMFCGRHHLQGLFEIQPSGSVNLRLRCPDCLHHGKREWIISGGMSELTGMKSFRPAFNRMQKASLHFWTSENDRERCNWCGEAVQVQLLEPGESFHHSLPWEGLKWAKYCSSVLHLPEHGVLAGYWCHVYYSGHSQPALWDNSGRLR